MRASFWAPPFNLASRLHLSAEYTRDGGPLQTPVSLRLSVRFLCSSPGSTPVPQIRPPAYISVGRARPPWECPCSPHPMSFRRSLPRRRPGTGLQRPPACDLRGFMTIAGTRVPLARLLGDMLYWNDMGLVMRGFEHKKETGGLDSGLRRNDIVGAGFRPSPESSMSQGTPQRMK